MTYTQLSQEERYFFSSNLARGFSIPQIAKEMDRAPSTLYREKARNLRPSGHYAAFVADSYATARRKRSHRGSQSPQECWDFILDYLTIQWSPEQIANHFKLLGLFSISFQTIYRHIRIDRRKGGSIYKDLRIMPKSRRKRRGSDDSRGVLRGKLMISDRPAMINNRSVFGHWEADTVMGKDKHECILTLVERKSGLARIAKLSNRTADLTFKAIAKIIAKEPHLFKTITFDNGGELVALDTCMVGTLKGSGTISLQTAIDCHSRHAWGNLYTSKIPVTAVHVLNDNVLPFFEDHGVKIQGHL